MSRRTPESDKQGVTGMSEFRIDHQDLEQFVEKVFVEAGLSEEDARVEAEVLVWANLRGIDSHGVLRIPSYLDSIESGAMNIRPNIQVLKETPAVLFVDADRAMGPVVTTDIMNRVIAKAKSVGIGWGLLRKNTHQGAMGPCGHRDRMQPAEHGSLWRQGCRPSQQPDRHLRTRWKTPPGHPRHGHQCGRRRQADTCRRQGNSAW